VQRAILLAAQENFILSSFTANLQIASCLSKLRMHQDRTAEPACTELPKNIVKQDHINSAKNTTELFEVYRENLKTKSKLLKFSHTKFSTKHVKLYKNSIYGPGASKVL